MVRSPTQKEIDEAMMARYLTMTKVNTYIRFSLYDDSHDGARWSISETVPFMDAWNEYVEWCDDDEKPSERKFYKRHFEEKFRCWENTKRFANHALCGWWESFSQSDLFSGFLFSKMQNPTLKLEIVHGQSNC